MKYRYCPYCGKQGFTGVEKFKEVTCPWCHSVTTYKESKYEDAYYKSKAEEKYGKRFWDYKILFEEESTQNPTFDPEKAKIAAEEFSRHTSALADKHLESIKTTPNKNVAKCPTCQSTNIKKISSTKRSLHAFAFGVFNKTAQSQFECENCGYKW